MQFIAYVTEKATVVKITYSDTNFTDRYNKGGKRGIYFLTMDLYGKMCSVELVKMYYNLLEKCR